MSQATKLTYILLAFTVGILISCNQNTNAVEEPGYDKPDGFAEYYNNITKPIKASKSAYPVNYRYRQLAQIKRHQPALKSAISFDWVQRGPGNVSGRTRAIVVDYSDSTKATWFAGSASGGIWKTNDNGNSWRLLTSNLPNLATTTLVQSKSNPTVLYAGTGEGFGGVGMVSGAGIFKSSDNGESWTQLESTTTTDNFKHVNRLALDPNNPDILIAATNKGLFKTTDGALTWDTLYRKGYRIQDIEANPENFNTLYATARYLGVLKSTNAGETWELSSAGLSTGYRHELAISPIDTAVLYCSVEAPSNTTHVYISYNAGKSWYRFQEEGGGELSFLGVQGWFNNSIEGHPYDKEKAFIGGVYLGSVEFSGTITQSENQVLRVDTFGTAAFMDVVNFGGQFLGGGLAVNTDLEASELEDSDFSNIEIRFGSGISQKAHRFTVPEGEGPGVQDDNYSFQDYVSVPFQVWDTDHNIQLMASFRDQERDGVFNLIEREADEKIKGREYLFVHAVTYAETALTEIATAGGQQYKQLFFLWPTLVQDSTWKADALPNSKIVLEYGQYLIKEGTSFTIADNRKNEHLHVDHHDLVILPTNETNKTFTIIDGNDGGLGVSYDNAKTWEQITNGYNTTQFYGVAKMMGSQTYIGGLQDNGTWRSQLNTDATATTPYEFMIEGDGFETVWHPTYKNRIIGSSYNNYLKVTFDTGRTWQVATDGINNDGPFVTRIASHPNDPDILFVAGNKGVYRHLNFGIGRFPWELISIPDTGYTINTSATSQHVVTISEADKNIVWVGEGMNENPELRLFVSKNQGNTFSTTTIYTDEEMGYITNIATHPSNRNTAYALFSIAEKPKILRTQNLGESWDDITKFKEGVSQNGFPDVMVYSLLVMPFDTSIIWAGTEIGILESTDNGASWHLANNGFPNVSVWQMTIQENTLIIATHGLGIWTAELSPTGIHASTKQYKTLKAYPNPVKSALYVELPTNLEGIYKVYTSSGQLVMSDQLSTSAKVQMIDCSRLHAGMYIMELKQNNTFFKTSFIVTE